MLVACSNDNQILKSSSSPYIAARGKCSRLPSDAKTVPMPTQHIDGMDLSHMDQHQPPVPWQQPNSDLGIFILFFVFRKVFRRRLGRTFSCQPCLTCFCV